MLHIDDVVFAYSSSPVLAGCSLTVASGEVVGLIGRNGAGKSTLMKLVAGQLDLAHGSITIGGYQPDTRDARMRTLLAASNDYLPSFVTGYEYLDLLSSLYHLRLERPVIDSFFERYSMAGRGVHLIEDYSHGMRKKLQLISAFLCARPLTLMDETLNGIDVDAALATQEDVRALAAGANAVLLCSHDFSYLEKVCHRVVMLDSGTIVDQLESSEFAHQSGMLEEWARSVISDSDSQAEDVWAPSSH